MVREVAKHREKKWRKCMGIEPTEDELYSPPNGFEDRGHHQVYKHFRRV